MSTRVEVPDLVANIVERFLRADEVK